MKAFALTMGSSLPVVALDSTFMLSNWPEPYLSLAGGALKGCASVFRTSAKNIVSMHLHPRIPHQLTLIQANMVRIVEDQIQILQHLREPETLRIVDPLALLVVHVLDPRERAVHGKVLVEALHRARRAREVLLVPRRAVGDELRLEDLRAEDVVRGGDVEAVVVVEGELGVGDNGVGAGVVAVGGDEGEDFGADAGAGED